LHFLCGFHQLRLEMKISGCLALGCDIAPDKANFGLAQRIACATFAAGTPPVRP